MTLRLFAHAQTEPELKHALEAFSVGHPSAAVETAHTNADADADVAFVFAGQSETRAGMGYELYTAIEAFRDVIDRCSAVVEPVLGLELGDLLYGNSDPAALDDARYAQPALFALQCALVAVWKRWGMAPAAVTGHSLGEYAAACCAEVAGVEEMATLVARRGQATYARADAGTMAVVFCEESALHPVLRAHGDRVTLAAINAPDVHVVSGPAADVEKAIAAVKARGISAKPLRISHAFHSICIEPILDELEEVAMQARLAAPAIPYASALEGRVFESHEVLDGRYWRRHARAPVRFVQAVQALADRGYRRFLEIGPHATLTTLGPRSIPGLESQWVASLKRRAHDLATMGEAASALWLTGVDIDLMQVASDVGWQQLRPRTTASTTS